MNLVTPPERRTLPSISFMLTAFFSIGWGMMFSGAVFPISLVLAAMCVASPFVVGFLARRLYRERGVSSMHRAAYYANLVFIGVLATGMWLGLLYSNRSLSTPDLSGTYLPDPETKANLERLHLLTPHHKIELREDGTFTMIGIPDFWQLTETPTALISATGTWLPQEGAIAIKYTGGTLIPPTAPVEYSYSSTIDVVGFFAPYKLRIILGDPDSVCHATFEKAP